MPSYRARFRGWPIGRFRIVKILVSVREIGSVHATEVAGPSNSTNGLATILTLGITTSVTR